MQIWFRYYVLNDSPWKKDSDWKVRYSRLYSTRCLNKPKEPSAYDSRRISFLSSGTTPQSSMMNSMKSKIYKANIQNSSLISHDIPSHITWLSQQSDTFRSKDDQQNVTTGSNASDTTLLDMVRARNRSFVDEPQDETLNLPNDESSDDDVSSECVHGLSMRMTERSISRSRVSRISTRRDMDIPSILAFNANIAAPVHLEIPAFRKAPVEKEELPRWSIRKSICPVCSQKWKDRSSITIVKNSGLKRSSSSDLPTVIAPARLRTAITIGYVPKPALAAVDEDAGLGHSTLRNNSASWQLTRARRFRVPKPQMPPPEAVAPPSVTAPLARKDLDLRVTKFLKDEEGSFKN